MRKLWEHPDLAALWNHHHEGGSVNWRTALHGWQATVDWPGCWEWEEFAVLWPTAPVILTIRDPGSWYDSVRRSIHSWTAPGQDVGPRPMAQLLSYMWDSTLSPATSGTTRKSRSGVHRIGSSNSLSATAGHPCAGHWRLTHQTSRSRI